MGSRGAQREERRAIRGVRSRGELKAARKRKSQKSSDPITGKKRGKPIKYNQLTNKPLATLPRHQRKAIQAARRPR